MAQKATSLAAKIEYKTLSFKLETVDEDQGIITGYLSTFNNIDLGNGYIRDRVLPGAYKRTINAALERKASKDKKYLWPHLWMHDPNMPIGGYVSAKEDAKGLLVTYQLDINKNTAGIPNNSTATMVFSGYKCGYIDEQSIGYEVIQSELVEEVIDGKKTMVRNLIEIRLWEGSSITSNFAMDPEALVTDVKSVAHTLDFKSVCGNTSGPIGPRDEAWDGSAAEKWIWSQALDTDDKVKTAVAKKYFMRLDGDATLKGSYSYPFWIDGHISVGACKAIANALSGARNADASGDTAGLKSKIETLYSRINKKYSTDTPLTPPWNADGKGNHMNTSLKQLKTLLEHYNEEMAEDLLEDWQDVYVCALTGAIFDAFTIGDQPEADIAQALDDFKELVLSKFVGQAIECDLSQYLSDNDYGFNPAERTIHNGSSPSSPYGYMSRRTPDGKAMTAGDATTGGFTTEHVAKLQKAATKASKAVADHVDALHKAADEVTALIGGSNQQDPKRRALPFNVKAGRTFSGSNVQALQDHADNLDDLADSHEKTMNRLTKQVTSVADDLDTIFQGSVPGYTSDPGSAGDQQEGKNAPRTPFNDRTRTTQHTRSSQDDTVTEDEIEAALGNLKLLRKPLTV